MTSETCAPGRRRWLALGVVVALLLLLGAGWLTAWSVRYFYARELEVRLHPVGADRLTSSGNPAGVRVLFLGDSRAAFWPALPADRFLTLNAGVPGETTAQIRLRTEAALSQAKPSVVVIQAGINDLKAIGVLPDAAREIQARCLTNLTEIVQLCRAHNARVVLSLIISPGRVDLARRMVWSDQIEPAVRAVNANLARQFAQVEGVVLLDANRLLKAVDYQDTLHLRPAAYQKLQTALLPLLER